VKEISKLWYDFCGGLSEKERVSSWGIVMRLLKGAFHEKST
jgi:hypothetical protein